MNPFLRIGSLLATQRTRSMVLGILTISRRMHTIARHEGARGLALRCKAYTLYLYALHGGHKSSPKLIGTEFGPHVSLTGKGVPRIIPSQWRNKIRIPGSWEYQLALTIFGLYRVLEFRGKLSVSTIVEPGKVISDDILIEAKKWGEINIPPLPDKGTLIPLSPITTSGPGSAQSETTKKYSLSNQATLGNSLYSIYIDDTLMSSAITIAKLLGKRTWDKFLPLISMAHFLKEVSSEKVIMERLGLQVRRIPLGKIGLKEEPGKVRVFAIVDVVTQWLLEPLHKHLFAYLSSIWSDATFDQDAAVEKARLAIREITMKNHGKAFVASYDLSAATDRLPLSVQKQILNGLKPGLGDAWGDFLVGRDYVLPKRAQKETGLHSVRYAVGQPIGALSSWAILAVTHHFCVYIAAKRAGVERPFSSYIVLGDDIIIWNDLVAKEYLDFITKDLGVKISLAKSLVSRTGVFEFAKRLVHPEFGIQQGVPLKEFGLASKNLAALAMLIKNFRTDMRASQVLKVLGFGNRVLGSLSEIRKHTRASFALRWALQPGLTVNSAANWLDWFRINGIGPIGAKRISEVPWISVVRVLREIMDEKSTITVPKYAPKWNLEKVYFHDNWTSIVRGNECIIEVHAWANAYLSMKNFNSRLDKDLIEKSQKHRYSFQAYLRVALNARFELLSRDLIEWQEKYLTLIREGLIWDDPAVVDQFVELLTKVPETPELDESHKEVPISIVARQELDDIEYTVPQLIKIAERLNDSLKRERLLKIARPKVKLISEPHTLVEASEPKGFQLENQFGELKWTLEDPIRFHKN